MQNIMSFKMRELLDIDGVIVCHLANAIIIYKKRFPSSYSVLIHVCIVFVRSFSVVLLVISHFPIFQRQNK